MTQLRGEGARSGGAYRCYTTIQRKSGYLDDRFYALRDLRRRLACIRLKAKDKLCPGCPPADAIF